jgi:pimeloyl-ACP methyl ester carboxylesterase
MRAKLPHTESFVDRDGVRLHYEVYGEGERTMLFLPAWAIVHSRIYKAQIPYFSDRFRVIAYDPRGNGKSDRPRDAESYSPDALLEDAIAVLDAVGADKAILYGLSRGGLTGAMAAAYFPERVEALISVSCVCPLVRSTLSRSVSRFDAVFEDPQGWEKFNRAHWQANYRDFTEFFIGQIFPEPHSTKQIEDALGWAAEGDGETLAQTVMAPAPDRHPISEDMYRRISCPVLLLHGSDDTITPPAMSEKVAELTGGELHVLADVGHAPNARFPGLANTMARDFLAEKLGVWRPPAKPRRRPGKRALYLSSPIGLGHARRDLAIVRELRAHQSSLNVDWLAQDPVTRLLAANNETLHPASANLASETRHIEEAAGEHDLNCFQALRDMDEILIRNFMVFQEAVETDAYDLVIADEAWDVDHYWHEHPHLKKAPLAWLTDFVGWAPMPAGGKREAMLTTDYNAEMIGHVEGHPSVRDRAIFVGNERDIVPLGFGADLPMMRDWVPRHFAFSGYILGCHPASFGPREALRDEFGFRAGEKVCIVAVGGSGVGLALIRRIVEAYPIAKLRVPELTMIVVAGPRIDPAAIRAPEGVSVRAFVPDLDRQLAACDLALVQGGLTTCMELVAAGTPFLYFPLQNHFEQNIHVAHRLDCYGGGRRMAYLDSSPDVIAAAMAEELAAPRRPAPVEADGAVRAAAMLAEML